MSNSNVEVQSIILPQELAQSIISSVCEAQGLPHVLEHIHRLCEARWVSGAF